jgi:hypothetical protein
MPQAIAQAMGFDAEMDAVPYARAARRRPAVSLTGRLCSTSADQKAHPLKAA